MWRAGGLEKVSLSLATTRQTNLNNSSQSGLLLLPPICSAFIGNVEIVNIACQYCKTRMIFIALLLL